MNNSGISDGNKSNGSQLCHIDKEAPNSHHSLQIPCDTDYTPPDNCLQYFTAITGTVQSYNFNGGDGPHLADQDQRICIRPARGYCTIGFAAAAIDATFGISGANAATAIVSK